MSSTLLKIIALLCMLIDHIGAFLIPECSILFRIIGRVAFPIFAFSLAQGFIKTSNFKRYLFRLGFWALVAQIPFSLLNGLHSSVILTMFLGLLFLKCYHCSITCDSESNSSMKLIYSICMIGILLLSDILRCDYGSYGILTIFIFYKYLEPKIAPVHYSNSFTNYINGSKKSLTISYTLMNIFISILMFMSSGFKLSALFNVQNYCLLALPLILKCNGQKGKLSLKHLFYIFYPGHLLIIYLIKHYILPSSYNLTTNYYAVMFLIIYPILVIVLAMILTLCFNNKLYYILTASSIYLYLYFSCERFSWDIKYSLAAIVFFIVGSICSYYLISNERASR